MQSLRLFISVKVIIKGRKKIHVGSFRIFLLYIMAIFACLCFFTFLFDPGGNLSLQGNKASEWQGDKMW